MKEMYRTQYNYLQSGINKYVYEFEEKFSSPNKSEWIIVPPDIQYLVITLEISNGGSGNVFTSNDLMKYILEDSALEIEWIYGTISSTRENSLRPIKAVRHQNFSGTTRLILSGG